MTPNTPNDTQHMLSIGRNGSGKTVAAMHELSFRSWDTMPWVVWDYKGDELIGTLSKMEGVRTIGLNDQLSKRGLHIIRPRPDLDDEAVDAFLWRLHSRGRVGNYFDEGYMIKKTDALNALFTQGRSKHCPIIMLAQRPVWLTKFAFSEASFFQIFHLNNLRDRKAVQEFVPADRANLEQRLPEYHSLWYDVKLDQVSVWQPVPPGDAILSRFRERLVPSRQYI